MAKLYRDTSGDDPGMAKLLLSQVGGGLFLGWLSCTQRRYDMRHEMWTQRALFPSRQYKKGTLSQHFMTHVVPPLSCTRILSQGV